MTEHEDLRQLAAELGKPPYNFEPCTMRKGVVVSIQPGTPPTLTVTLSDSPSPVPGVRFTRSYRPVVDDVVLMFKQGTDIVVFDSIAETTPVDQTFAALTATSLTASGTVQGGTVTSTGAVNAASVTASGTVQGATVNSTGNLTASGQLNIRSSALASGTRAANTEFIDGKLNTHAGTSQIHDLRQPVVHKIYSVSNHAVIPTSTGTFASFTFTPRSNSFAEVNVSVLFTCDEGLSGQNFEPTVAYVGFRLVRVSDGVTVYSNETSWHASPAGADTWNTFLSDSTSIVDISDVVLSAGTQYRIDLRGQRPGVLAVYYENANGYIKEVVRAA